MRSMRLSWFNCTHNGGDKSSYRLSYEKISLLLRTDHRNFGGHSDGNVDQMVQVLEMILRADIRIGGVNTWFWNSLANYDYTSTEM